MVLSGILYYQDLEKENISLLEEKCGNYEAKISSLNKRVIEDLKWWLKAIPNAINNINTSKVYLKTNSDVNETEQGAKDEFNPT